MDLIKFKAIETIYNELKNKFQNEEISYEEMKGELQKLVVRDENDNYWMLGANTGKWYIYDGSDWVEKSPYEEQPLDEKSAIKFPPREENLSEKAKKKPPQSKTLIFGAVAAVIMIVLIYLLVKTKSSDTSSSPAKEGSSVESISKKPQLYEDEKNSEQKIWELSNEVFQGSSPMKVKESGPVFSEKKDPEIVAIAKAFKIRVEILKGTRTRKLRGMISQISEGNFQDFYIKSTHTKRQDKVIKDEIILTTPSKGIITIRKNLLFSVKKTDYQKFHQDLKDSGIEVISHPNQENKMINVQMNIIKYNGKRIEDTFLINQKRVGTIEIGMPIEMIESVLPPNYIIFKRDIWHNNKSYNVYKIFDENRNSLFFVYSQEKKVWGIQVVSNRFRTKRGIGLDNTLGDFLIYYSKIKISTTATGAPYAFIKKPNVKFFLQSNEIDFENEIFPNQATIIWILLGDSPYLE